MRGNRKEKVRGEGRGKGVTRGERGEDKRESEGGRGEEIGRAHV